MTNNVGGNPVHSSTSFRLLIASLRSRMVSSLPSSLGNSFRNWTYSITLAYLSKGSAKVKSSKIASKRGTLMSVQVWSKYLNISNSDRVACQLRTDLGPRGFKVRGMLRSVESTLAWNECRNARTSVASMAAMSGSSSPKNPTNRLNVSKYFRDVLGPRPYISLANKRCLNGSWDCRHGFVLWGQWKRLSNRNVVFGPHGSLKPLAVRAKWARRDSNRQEAVPKGSEKLILKNRKFSKIWVWTNTATTK